MKLLQDILYKVRLEGVVGNTNVAVESITSDSRAVRPMALFVAVKGLQSDGHLFIAKAIELGAAAVVCEDLPERLEESIVYVQVADTSKALGIMAANFYENPSEKMKVLAVTGTNGKTTVATLLFRLYRSMGFKCGLLSTVVNRINEVEIPSTHTTPDAVALNDLLARMQREGCTHVFMEASSHALHQNRMAGVHIDGAIFTNLSHDHLDYHGSMNEYIKAKKILFDQLGASAYAVVNADDRYHDALVSACKARVRTYALHTMADYKAKLIENTLQGLQINIDRFELHSPLIGEFNAYNLTAVFAAAVELGTDPTTVLVHLSALGAPEGRFQYIRKQDGTIAIVDYAHTPDALENVLNTIQSVRGQEEIISVVGCGGDRDRTKRPIMASIAANKSDRVIVTSDNPRSEDPKSIIQEMVAGLDPIQKKKVLSVTDRREAIEVACSLAKPGDIILIAGKGHEKYQEISGVKYPFDDLQIITELFQTN
jgi:UDP-N-acetylmuramoyl-L-alanyl-D-glutamate--2,6-diaminopimelate ligase